MLMHGRNTELRTADIKLTLFGGVVMKEFLCKFQEIRKDEDGKEFLVCLNHKVSELISRPLRIIGNGECVEIEKEVIVCDGCNEPNPEYVLMDDEMLYRTVCENCRVKYWKKYKVIRGEEVRI